MKPYAFINRLLQLDKEIKDEILSVLAEVGEAKADMV